MNASSVGGLPVRRNNTMVSGKKANPFGDFEVEPNLVIDLKQKKAKLEEENQKQGEYIKQLLSKLKKYKAQLK